MQFKNSLETYGLIHQFLHWTTALLILILIPMGIYMHNLPDGNAQEVEAKFWLYSLHKTVGLAAFAAAVIRIIWAILQPHPRALHGGLEGFAAKSVHHILYGAIMLMPLLGWFHHAASEGYAPIWWPFSQNLFFIPKNADLSQFFGLSHFATGILLVISLVLHIGGTLKHVILDKDKTLQRMVPFAYASTGNPPELKTATQAPLYITLVAFVITYGATFIAYQTGAGHHPLGQEDSPGQTGMHQTKHQPQNAPADGERWQIDYAESELTVEIIQMGSTVKGQFVDWSASVLFDPDNLAAARIEAEVNVTAFDFGDLSDRAVSDEFLNAATFPTALFFSDVIVANGDDFIARGQITIAGVKQPLDIGFSFKQTDGLAIVNGTASIQRLDFGIGKDFPDDSSVGRQVQLSMSIIAKAP